MSTHVKIQTITVGAGGAASIDFTSIPATYTDLKLVVSGRGTLAATISDMFISFNGSTASFTNRYIQANGSSAASSSYARYIGTISANTAGASIFASMDMYIPNYLSANYKSFSVDCVAEENGATAYSEIIASLWSVTSAINQITITTTAGTLAEFSSATLYGIKSS